MKLSNVTGALYSAVSRYLRLLRIGPVVRRMHSSAYSICLLVSRLSCALTVSAGCSSSPTLIVFFTGAKRFGHQGRDLVKLRGAHAQVLKQRDILDLTFHPRPPAVQLALFRKDEMDRSDWFRFFWIVLDSCFFNCEGSLCAGFSCV